jgi:hypothetical protein
MSGQLEDHVNQSCEIYRMSVFFRRLEPDLLGNAFCRLIQAVSQSIHYAQYLNLPTCHETHLQSYLALDPQLSSFRCVLGMRLGKDHRRYEGRFRSDPGGRNAAVEQGTGRVHDAGEASRYDLAHVFTARDTMGDAGTEGGTANSPFARCPGAGLSTRSIVE